MSQTKTVWLAVLAGAGVVLAVVNGASAIADILRNNEEDAANNN